MPSRKLCCLAAAALVLLNSGCCPTSDLWLLKTGESLINGAPIEWWGVTVFLGEPLTFEAEVAGGTAPLMIEVFGPVLQRGEVRETLLASGPGSSITFQPSLSGSYRMVVTDAGEQSVEWLINIAVLAYES